MRLLMWLSTILFALAGLALRAQPPFAGAVLVGTLALLLAGLACPLLWARPLGLVPDALVIPGKRRLLLALALILAAPLILPWPLWL